MIPNRAEIKSIFTKRFLFQLFSVGAIFLFLLSSILQPSFWSLKTAYADVNGLGVRFDDQSYSTSLASSLTNTGSQPSQTVSTELRAFHCSQAAGDICIPNGSSDFLTEQRFPVTITFPAPGTESRQTFSAPDFSPRCGRVQVDVGGDNGVYGGKTFSLGSDCAAPPPANLTASLSSSCPNNTPTLNATWDVGSGSSCNIYVQAGNTPNVISQDCKGSFSGSSLSPSGAVVNGGIYHLYASNGQTTVDGGQTTVSCGTPPPPPPSSQCNYSSTQARWQVNTSDPWDSSKTITLGQSANVGSFHDTTGQFASDTTLTITGPGNNTTRTNGQSFQPSQAGTYTLTVTTNGQSGAACTDTATLIVNQVTPQCTWDSTQARVQRDLNDPWASSRTINLGDQIRVGGFHNGTGLFADPGTVSLNVAGPQSFSNLSNGQFITPDAAGTFTLRVTTPNQSGPNCEDSATFQVQVAASPTPTPTPSPSPSPSSSPSPSASPSPSPSPSPAGGINITNNNTNTNTNTNTQNNNQNQTVNVTQSPQVALAVQPQVAGVSVSQLPKTGLPQLAWLALAFIPAGFGMRRFRNLKKTLADDPNYIWEERKFKAS